MPTKTNPNTDTGAGDGPATVTPGARPELAAYDMLLVGMSGKDGDAAAAVVRDEAAAAGVLDRLYTAHADLGLIEWPSVEHHGVYYPSNREMVERSATHFGIPPTRQIYTRRTVTDTGVVRPQTLLEYIADRGRFPDKARRYCTSDMKVSKIMVALTPHVKQLRTRLDRPVRILNITGMRAEESRDRSKLDTYTVATANSARQVDNWLPIHTMSTSTVQELVDTVGIGHHWAYDSEPGAGDWNGMGRLSCSKCILGNKQDLILSARRRPRLAALYAEVEAALGHEFRLGMSMRQIIEWARLPGGKPPGVVLTENNPEFDTFAAAVRSRLVTNPVPLRGGTEFNAIPAARCVSCG